MESLHSSHMILGVDVGTEFEINNKFFFNTTI